MAKTRKPVTDVLIEPDVEGLEPISDEKYGWLQANILDHLKATIPEPRRRQAAEKLAHILETAASMCAHRWSVRNYPDRPIANRPRNINMRQWIRGSLAGFWAEYVGHPGVSSNGEHYGGPFARFALAMSGKLLEALRSNRRLRDAPFVKTLELVSANPRKVRMWLCQVGSITQLGSNFEGFLRGEVFLAGELPGWQFEVDEPRENCYQVTAIDPEGRSRFKPPEYGLNLAAVKKAAVARAKRLSRSTRKSRPK